MTCVLCAGDFDWNNPFIWFRNLDKLIHHTNEVGARLVLQVHCISCWCGPGTMKLHAAMQPQSVPLQDGRVNVIYSTPRVYAEAKKSYKKEWPLALGDMFPYADCVQCYWSGVRQLRFHCHNPVNLAL